jgi:mono/diheme cytochrome c family protein
MKRIAVALAAALATSAFADGAAVYAAKCKICHGAEGKGGSMYKESIKGKDPAKVIAEGKGKMKPITLGAEDAKAVSEYVKGLK